MEIFGFEISRKKDELRVKDVQKKSQTSFVAPVEDDGTPIIQQSPGGFISGILTHYKKGNIPLSVSLTSLTSLISPFTTVFWLSIISIDAGEFSFRFLETLIQLVVLIFLPFLIGYFLNLKNLSIVNGFSSFLDKFFEAGSKQRKYFIVR